MKDDAELSRFMAGEAIVAPHASSRGVRKGSWQESPKDADYRTALVLIIVPFIFRSSLPPREQRASSLDTD